MLAIISLAKNIPKQIVTLRKFVVLQVFFLFSSTNIGHGRPSVKDRYAISDKNILRSYVVRYFYLKFLACHSSMPWEMYQKKGKKMGWAVRGGGDAAV